MRMIAVVVLEADTQAILVMAERDADWKPRSIPLAEQIRCKMGQHSSGNIAQFDQSRRRPPTGYYTVDVRRVHAPPPADYA
jgi:hypothetical protein